MKNTIKLLAVLLIALIGVNQIFAQDYPAPRPVDEVQLCIGEIYIWASGATSITLSIYDPVTGDSLYGFDGYLPEPGVYSFPVFTYLPPNAILSNGYWAYEVADLFWLQGDANPYLTVTACTGAYFSDGRVQFNDAAAPAIVFGNARTGIEVYPAERGGQGFLSISAATIATAGVPASGSVILGEAVNPVTGKGVVISRLSNGEFQMDTQYPDGKAYTIRWTTGWEDYRFVSH